MQNRRSAPDSINSGCINEPLNHRGPCRDPHDVVVTERDIRVGVIRLPRGPPQSTRAQIRAQTTPSADSTRHSTPRKFAIGVAKPERLGEINGNEVTTLDFEAALTRHFTEQINTWRWLSTSPAIARGARAARVDDRIERNAESAPTIDANHRSRPALSCCSTIAVSPGLRCQSDNRKSPGWPAGVPGKSVGASHALSQTGCCQL